MTTEANLKNFRKKIKRLMESESHSEAGDGPVSEFSIGHRNYDPYQAIAARILKHTIEPRIEIAADIFVDASIEVNADVGYARLSFLPSGSPSLLYLLFSLRLDHSTRIVWLYAESCLTPYTMVCEPAGKIAISLGAVNFKKVEAFIEKEILKFLKAAPLFKPYHNDNRRNEDVLTSHSKS